ncbi:helix-turn-helix transcriptional regulator [Myxacorys almedinensis]|uniref:Helix-turn-helix domain-containing protein n=1 Tax=Myxacorys almedinensis A TaxID=2690445 RepID=A0A8J8CIU6_9CYAN|nr:AraC family transcriptional regulator [Myxacorys almedinensis]NDJ16911.1 helix-turn-helix domain-containing protein [Myxacorys almedinensis A]
MTISVSERDWAEWEEALSHLIEYPDPGDPCDVLMPKPTWLAQGYRREIALREGLTVLIDDFRMRDRSRMTFSEDESWLQFHCHLSGDHQNPVSEVGNLEYALHGSGVVSKGVMTCSGQFPILEVIVEMSPEFFLEFAGQQGTVPLEFQQLIGTTQPSYARVGALSPVMQGVLRQIIQCPYRGLMKRMYLESKALELAALILEQEQEVQQGRSPLFRLKAEEVDRIHHAHTILLRNLDQPPSLSELARQAGLNEKALKQGFRQVFGKPVFGYLHDYRMDQAQQLLMTGEMKVGEVMAQVGFRDRRYFAETFRKKFGTNPKDYLKARTSRSCILEQ